MSLIYLRIVMREPLAKRRKSNNPCPIMVLFVRSITLGSGPNAEGGLLSP